MRFELKNHEERNLEGGPVTKHSVRGRKRADPPGVSVVLYSKQEKIGTYPRGVCGGLCGFIVWNVGTRSGNTGQPWRL